jgi:hypothetical protein
MHPALATLETTARQLQLSGELERSEFGRIMRQLRVVADGLDTLERRTAKQKAASVNMVELLRAALAPADADSGPGEEVRLPSQDMTVEGPAHDLRDLFCTMIEYARAVGSEPLDLRAHIRHDAGTARETCTMQLLVHAPDLPDFLRRKLWDAARVRGGEVSVISEPTLCRIAFTLPIERRLATAD